MRCLTRSRRALALPAFVLALQLAASCAQGQTRPTYPQLFQDPPQPSRISALDLFNLTRLAQLEAISLSVHIREDLGDSPLGQALSQRVGELLLACDDLNSLQAPETAPQGQDLDAAREAFVEVEKAFANLIQTLGPITGAAPSSSGNLDQLSRLLSVTRPFLAIDPADIMPVERSPDIKALVAKVARLLGTLGSAPKPSTAEVRLRGEIIRLLQLLQGYLMMVASNPEPADLELALRPVLRVSSTINLKLSSEPISPALRTAWREISGEIEQLGGDSRGPLVLSSRPRTFMTGRLESAIVSSVDRAVAEIDRRTREKLQNREDPSIPMRPQAEDRRLRTSLILARQSLVGQDTLSEVLSRFREADRLADLLSKRLDVDERGASRIVPEPLNNLRRAMDELRARLSEIPGSEGSP